MIAVEKIICGPLGVNTYVVHHQGREDCVIVDAADCAPVISYVKEKGLTVAAILITHGHFDHIFGLADLQRETGAKVYVHEADEAMLRDEGNSLASSMRVKVKPCRADVLLKGGEQIEAAGMTFEAIYTPGHTRGGICYLNREGGALFTGDTLFKLSVGRSDFEHSNTADLKNSVRNVLGGLEGDYGVYPGHMGDTTLNFEREKSPFFHSEVYWK